MSSQKTIKDITFPLVLLIVGIVVNMFTGDVTSYVPSYNETTAVVNLSEVGNISGTLITAVGGIWTLVVIIPLLAGLVKSVMSSFGGGSSRRSSGGGYTA